ncbi:ELM2 domain protein [Cryptosporidium felis]|nr:ELM2 domain protein [Cryptosporidium felis]
MSESRWMKQLNSKIRIGPEYQAVLPDLQVPEGSAKLRILQPVCSDTPNAKGVYDRGDAPKSSTQQVKSQSLGTGGSKPKSEKASQKKPTASTEHPSKKKNPAKTQKTISKSKTTKSNSAFSSKSSKKVN